MTRYLFLCPDRTSASGGIAVIYDIVALLCKVGYSAAIVHNSPDAGYPDYQATVPAYYTRRMEEIYYKYAGPRGKMNAILNGLRRGQGRLPLLMLRPGDVIIVPEFQFPEAIEAFKGQSIATLVQNPFSLMTSYHRASQRKLPVRDSISFWFGIAEIVRSHFSALNLAPHEIFPVSMKPHEFPYQKEKEPLITYMPRKRPWEADIMVEALTNRNKLHRYKLQALENLTRAQVAEKLGQTRIFISLLQQEALGFPAAEAMAAGCIVVGFDGLGTAEYFCSDTGVPVVEGDVASLIVTIESIVAEYEASPARLDAMRLRASCLVNDKYSVSKFEEAFLGAWGKFELELRR